LSDYGNDWDYDGEFNEKDEELDENRSEGTKLEEKNEDFNPNKNVEDPSTEYEDFDPNEEVEELFAERIKDEMEETRIDGEKSIKGVQEIKDYIKNLDWENIAKDWTVTYRPKFGDHRIILLNPSQDCSQDNPLYTHKKWLDQIYNNKELQLTDQKIAEICGVQKTTIGRWRKRHDISTKEGNKRSINKMGYVRLSLPIEYQHPELKPHRGSSYYRLEHSVVMEDYLSKISDTESLEKFSLTAEELKEKFLVEGKYLKLGCQVHHINYIHHDNRLANLYPFKTDADHKKAINSLSECFRDLVKLDQICFKDGKYYLNEDFDYRDLKSSEIKEILKQEPVNPYEDINLVKEECKNINWDEISNDWTIKYRPYGYIPYRTISLDPYSDCSEQNPLYRHKAWVERLVHEENFNLTDSRLGEVCGITRAKMVYWRERKHNIYTRSESWGFGRFQYQRSGKIGIKVPDDYDNPFAKKQKGKMYEHRYVMERHLTENPELEQSKKFLTDGKYLKSECSIHHINVDPTDNKLKNLWVCENEKEHQSIQSSLLTFVDELLKSELISFENGEYKIKVKNENISYY